MGVPDEGGEYTSIDVDALGQAVEDLDATLTGLTDHISGLESDFGYFGVDKSNLNKLLEAKTDLEDIMPDMRRRHSLAVQLLAEQQGNGWAGDGVIRTQGTDILDDTFDSITDAKNAGSDLANTVNNADGEIPPEVYEQLEQYGHDPDFAEAFINGLTPASRGLLLIDADQQAEGADGDPDDDPQLALAEVFATASFRIDYDEEFIAASNEALLDMGLHPDGIQLVDRISALTQHGSWDHGSLVAFAEAAAYGDSDSVGKIDDWAAIWTSLARNPRASAEFMAAHREDVWEGMQFGEYESQEARAAFIKAATVDAGPIYARLQLYDEDQPNLAEQNAAFVIEQVGSLDEPFPFNEHLREVFVDMTEEYWDDLVYSFNSPAGVSDNPDRDGIEVDPKNWQAFITEGMRDPEGAARLHSMMSTWYTDYIESTAGAADGQEHFWDDMMARNFAGMFSASWDTVLNEYAEDEAKREEFINSLVDAGFNLVLDPQQTVQDLINAPKDIFVNALKNTVAQAIIGATAGDGPPDLSYEFAGTHQTWVNAVIAEYNERGEIPEYNDGDVTWGGKENGPKFYEDLYGGKFTDDSGNVIPPFLPNGDRNPDFPDDPNALHAFNQWVQSPAVQKLIGEERPSLFD